MKKTKSIIFVVITVLLIGAGIILGFSLKNVFSPSFGVKMSSETVIKELKALNRLETASFTIEKVIDAGSAPGNPFVDFLYGDRILLIAHGQVIAGIDLSKLQAKDVVISGSSIQVTLPSSEVLVTTLDSNQTRVYDRKLGVLNKGDKDLESKARLAAESAIREGACRGNILEEASNNARKQLTALFKTLGFTSVTIAIPSGSC